MKQQRTNQKANHKDDYLFSQFKGTILNISFLLLVIILSFGCGNNGDLDDDDIRCLGILCGTTIAVLELNIIKDGQDIVFGPSPLIDVEELSVQSEEFEDRELTFYEDKVRIGFILNERFTLEIGNLKTVTLQVETENVSTLSCCPVFEITRIVRDGVTVCTSDCRVLDIEID